MGSTTRFAFVLTTALASILLLSVTAVSALDPQGPQDPQDQDQDQGASQAQQSQLPDIQDWHGAADSRPVSSRDPLRSQVQNRIGSAAAAN
jgi:hypothetical protein